MSVLTPFDPWRNPLCTCPRKYQLSPYTGCGHRCAYCYITAYVPRAFDSRPKTNFLARLRRDLVSADRTMHVSMSNSSDPYTPEESELGLTRETLRLLFGSGFDVQLITKSDLVVRDLDLLVKGNSTVSLTITTLDRHTAALLEPEAPSPEKRIEAIGLLSKSGIPCAARIDPIIRGINDGHLEELVRKVCAAGARHIVASTFKAKQDSLNRLVHLFPSLEYTLRKAHWNEGERIGRSRYLRRSIRKDLLGEVLRAAAEQGVTFAECREGLGLNTGATCDGSHLIPRRKR